MELIRWFETLRKEDVLIGGGKGANLGELIAAGVPVPPGFVITPEAFEHFLDAAGLREEILACLRDLDVNDTAALQKASEALRERVLAAEIPPPTRASSTRPTPNCRAAPAVRRSSWRCAPRPPLRTGRTPPLPA